MDREMARRTVFGLDVWSDGPLSYLDAASAPATGRVLDVLIDREGLTRWPRSGCEADQRPASERRDARDPHRLPPGGGVSALGTPLRAPHALA